MAKVYDITPIELRPGVKGSDLEAFWLNEYGPQGRKLDWISHLLLADRGDRAGKYAVLWEMPSVELRDRYVPEPDRISAEALHLLGPEFDALNERLMQFITDWPYSQYIELG